MSVSLSAHSGRPIALAPVGAIAAVALGLFSAIASSAPGEASVRVADDTVTSSTLSELDCSYATSGEGNYLDTICWLDLSTTESGMDEPTWAHLTLNLPGHYVLEADRDLTTPRGFFTSAPADEGSLFGNGIYSGISGHSVYAADTKADDGPSQIRLQNMRLLLNGASVSEGFSIVAADAGTTRDTESISWASTDKSLREWERFGAACGGSTLGDSALTFSCRGSDANSTSVVIGADAPQILGVSTKGSQAVAFGIVLPSQEPRLTIDIDTGATQVPAISDVVRYTISAKNPFSVPFTDDTPAHVTADLRGVVDDAASVTVISPPSATYSTGTSRVTWTGALADSETVQIVLDVRYSGAGDQKLTPTVFGTDAAVGETLPDCAAVACASHALLHPALTVVKSGADGAHATTPATASVFIDGESQDFTYTVTNTGNVPLTDVVVTDSFNGAAPVAVCSIPTIPVGGSANCTVNTIVPRFFGSEETTP